LKKEGDSIKPGDILAQIETDKATVDFEMQEEGYIAKLLYPEGSKDVKLGQVVAIIVDNKEDVEKFKDYTGAAPAAPQKAAPATPAAEEKRSCPASLERPSSTPDPSFAGAGRVFASPLAKKTAEESNVDLKGI
jgi:pyruvate dehydrogenase E2 component (dihydrolipoamide acetyltransferase)